MRIIFAAYRDWAIAAVNELRSHDRIEHAIVVNSLHELEAKVASTHGTPEQFDLVVLCGWSWQVSKDLLAKILVISEHPADRDEYSLGTPLQNQILDGTLCTRHRVVKIGHPELSERLFSAQHDVPMSLEGSMDEILERMRSTSVEIYTRFFDDYPAIEWQQWPKAAELRVPRVPADSRIKRADFSQLTVRSLYDRMRMLGGPYPRAFIEDEHGTMYFDAVRYVPKC